MTDQQAPPTATAGAQDQAGPPPLTAFAWRNNLVRPTQGRLLAGVCGALGRATNTDPVLWRVLIAVLAIFGGIGVVLYLLGWLLLPADGDTASPVESVLGRGHSATSNVLTVIGAVIVLMSFPVLVSEPFRPGPWGIVLVGGALLLLLRDRRKGSNAAAPPPAGTYPVSTGAEPATSSATSGDPMASPAPPSPAAPPYPAQPFAPRGPFAPPPSPPAGYPAVAPPPPPRPKPPRSRLGRLTFSVLLVVVGVMGLVDLAGYSVPGPTYFAAALAVVGLGLVLGAWVGRARGLIALGIVLSFLTAGATLGPKFDGNVEAGEQKWVVSSFDQLRPSYEHTFGNAELDLTQLPFTDSQNVTVDVAIGAGNLEITVPPNVDVTVDADIDLGNADVFNQSWSGLDPAPRTVTDYGPDGPGGGTLRINASVDAGNLEVDR